MMQDNSDNLDYIPSSTCKSSVSSSQPCGEASFDSGYCTSPARLAFLELSSLPLSSSPFRMDPNMPSVRRQPFSPQKIVKSDNTEAGYFLISPVEDSSAAHFSPFKTSTLSPFKQINQSPSKGALDDWDRDFISGFEENLFGMHDLGDLSDSVIGELMKSPQGKALLQKTNSPVRLNIGGRSRKPIVSQRHGAVADPVIVDVTNSGAAAKTAVVKIKDEPIEFYTVIKQEPEDKPELHNEHNYHAGHSTLSATDPDKMNATPIKPGIVYDGKTAPKRNLAFIDNGHRTDNTANLSLTQQKENSMPSIGLPFHLWPSKDRLKFARENFKQILDKTVKDKIETFMASQAILNKGKSNPDTKRQLSRKHKITKHKTGKFSRKASKKERYPQIKKALSKPAVSQSSKKSTGKVNAIIPKEKLPLSYDPGWYPDEDDSDDSDSGSWYGPVPFQRQMSHGFYDNEDDDDDDDSDNVYVDVDIISDDEYYPRNGGKKRNMSGKGLGKKKRKM